MAGEEPYQSERIRTMFSSITADVEADAVLQYLFSTDFCGWLVLTDDGKNKTTEEHFPDSGYC